MAGGSLQDSRAALVAATAALSGLRGQLWQAGDGGLGEVFAEVAALVHAAGAAQVALVDDVAGRGVVTSSPHASVTDWALAHGPSLGRTQAARLVRVTTAARLPRHTPVREALLTGRVGLGNADVVLAEFGKLRHRLRPEAAPTVLEGFLQVAERGGPTEIRELRQRIIARYGNDGEFQRDQDQLRRLAGLSCAVDDDGISGYRLRLDPEAAAVLEAALDPLAAPQPSSESGPDTRSSDQRRAEALIELVRRAVAAGESVPTTTRAQVIVTIDHTTLLGQLAMAAPWPLPGTAAPPGTAGAHDGAGALGLGSARTRDGTGGAGCARGAGLGAAVGPSDPGCRDGTSECADASGTDGSLRSPAAPGAGSTLGGLLLAPETVRKLACDARITPVVLGTDSAVLDVGHSRRLVTPAQLAALWVRDGGCTFPGCTRPPAWCHAHHVIHWCDGGPTDLLNLALLCQRHHTHVHQQGLTATVTAFGVTWHT